MDRRSPLRSMVGEEGSINMDRKSPLRSMVGDGDERKPPFWETEFHGGLPKSPMRDRFLDDLGRTPMVSRDASRSPMRGRVGSDGFDNDGINSSAARSRNVSKSPLKGRGGTPVSMRTRDVRRSPMMEGMSFGGLNGVGRSPTQSMNGDVPKSSLRQDLGSDFEGNSEDERFGKMRPKASFNSWLSDDKHEGQSGDNYSGGRRSTWRDRAVDRPDQYTQGVKSVFSDEHDLASKGSPDHSVHGIGPSKGGVYQRGRFKNANSDGYARPNVADEASNYYPDPVYGYGGPRQSFESARGPSSVQELQRAELLRKYNELKDQLNGLDNVETTSVDGSSRLTYGSTQSHHGPGIAYNREDMFNNQPMYVDQYDGQMKRRPRSNQQFSIHKVPEYVPERSMNYDQDQRDSYVNDTHAHHPACSCSLCYSNVGKGQDQHRRHGNMHFERCDPGSYDPRIAHPGPRGRPSHSMHHHKRVAVSSLNKRLCRPISGGAPFVLCNNCFELLKLPGNRKAKHKDQQLQCGACSTVFSFDLQHKSVDPLSPQMKPDSVNVGCFTGEVPNELGPKPHRDSVTATSTNIGSYDFDAGGYTFKSMSSEASILTKGDKFNSSLAEKNLEIASSQSRISVDERISDTTSVRSSQQNSSEVPMATCPPLKKQIIDSNASPEAPLDITEAVETEVHYSELPSTGVSRDSGDMPRESPVSGSDNLVQTRIDVLLNGIESLSAHNSSRKAEVYVNGQAIPYRLIKTAEKLAGPIQPGEYWYDPKAGFWGVMGHQCIGIIPPFIQEFGYPMPENCSRGDSDVFVNGRELQESDLELLARRGLPTTISMRYIVDISGKVVDERTKDFIVNLGRLAPSVERNKCGFGMQVPEQFDD
ncbi:uncharacterized protein LOC141587390 isoform X2 [Silene latifolia]